MRLRINIFTFLSFVFSIFSFMTFWFYSNLFGEELFFYLGLPFSLLIFSLFYFIFNSDAKQVTIITGHSETAFISPILTIVLVLLLVFIPPYEGSIINWVNVPLQNWLRGFASLLLTSFLPGYFLLKIVDRGKAIMGGMLMVLSNLLSMFIMFLLGFFMLLFGYSISPFLATVIVIIINLVGVAFYCFFSSMQKGEAKLAFSLEGDNLIVFFTLLFVLSGALSVMLYCMPLTWSDMYSFHSQGLDFSRGFPAFFSYPYLFPIYLSLAFAVSGLPSALTMQLLYIFSFIPVLGFYSMVKQWFSKKGSKRVPATATFFSTLLGFQSLYLLYSKIAEPEQSFCFYANEALSKTYDSYMRFPFAPCMVVPRWPGLAVLFSLLYLLKNENCRARNLFFILLTLTGYLLHPPEIFFFIPLLFVWEIFFESKPNWKMGLSILLGLLMVGLFDFLSPRQIYTLSIDNTTGKSVISLPYAILLLAITLLLGIGALKQKGVRFSAFGQYTSTFMEKIWRYVNWIPVYLYLFCLVVWLSVVKDYNIWSYGGGEFVPFWVFPMRWGAIGLMVILSIYLYFSDILHNRELSFFTLVFAIGIVLEQISNYFPIPYEDVSRYAAVTCIGGSVIAAYGTERILCCFTRRFSKKKLISSFLLFLLILSSALSTTVYYTHMSYLNGRGEVISSNELQAIEYIKNHFASNESVLTFTHGSAYKLGTFAGISVQSLYPYGPEIVSRNIVDYVILNTNTKNPYLFLYILGASNTRYIYVAKADYMLLSAKPFLINSLLKYLPEVLKNQDVTVYEVPKLTLPSQNFNASISVVHLFSSKTFLRFDGVDDTVTVPPSTSLNIPVNQTVSLWVRLNRYPTKTYCGIIFKTGCYGIGISKDGRVGYFVWGKSKAWSAADVIKVGEWYHIAWTYDGVVHKVYVNGVVVVSKTVSETIPALSNPICISNNVGGHPYYEYPNCDISGVRIYNRVLNKDEINSIYEDRDQNNAGLVLQLDFDGDLNDKSGNKNNGVNNGATFITSSDYLFSEGDSLIALVTATLGLKYSIICADDALAKQLDTLLSNSTGAILPSDPKKPIPSILNWVSTGHTLVVFNTNGNGYFSSLLYSNFSLGSFINVRDVGLGKIVYVNIHPMLDSYENHNLLFQLSNANITSTIKGILHSQGCNIASMYRPGITYNMTYGKFEVIGSMNLSTDLLIMKNTTLFDQSFTQGKLHTLSICGKTTLIVQNATLLVSPSELYLLIKSKNSLIRAQINIDSKVRLYGNGVPFNLTSVDGEQKQLNFEAEEILAKLPSVNACGAITFDSFVAQVAPYTLLAGILFEKAKVLGHVELSCIYVSDPFIVFSRFAVNGSVSKLDESTKNTFPIPWANVLLSPYNVALNSLLSGIAIGMKIKNKKR